MGHIIKKKLVKNTLLLYMRTIIVMFVSLYVSRLVLGRLGVTDFGVYNAVGGLVGMFSLVSGSLVAATQRFITFELGKKDGLPNQMFSVSFVLHAILGAFVILFGEFVGFYFLNNCMNLPVDRVYAANTVLHFSLIAFVSQLMSIPFNALIVAYEKMGYFAIIGIVEVLLKLINAIVLVFFSEKLIAFSLGLLVTSGCVFLMNFIYCKKNFPNDCRFSVVKSLEKYKALGKFMGWNFFGSASSVLSRQGVNLLLNVFFGVVVNAARGVTSQIENAITQFVSSFTTALRPQIIKSYAAGDYASCNSLVVQATKIVLYLSLFFEVPIFFNADALLRLWLTTVPDYAGVFVRLSLIILLWDALSTPLYFLMLATGKIKGYQLTAGVLCLLTFPLTWLFFKLGCSPEVFYYILGVVYAFRWLFQIFFLNKSANLDFVHYAKNAIFPVLIVSIVTIAVVSCVCFFIPSCSVFRLIVSSFISVIALAVSIYAFGFSREEKSAVLALFKNKLGVKS